MFWLLLIRQLLCQTLFFIGFELRCLGYVRRDRRAKSTFSHLLRKGVVSKLLQLMLLFFVLLVQSSKTLFEILLYWFGDNRKNLAFVHILRDDLIELRVILEISEPRQSSLDLIPKHETFEYFFNF